MYDAGIPFNAVKYDSFEPCIEAIGQFGSGMKPPSYHEVRVKYLKELANTNSLLKSHKEDHAKLRNLQDGWMKPPSYHEVRVKYLKELANMNSLLKSHKEDHAKFGCTIMADGWTDKKDNASCNVSTGRLLENRFPHLYWTPCAAHCLDLLLEDIFKIPHLRKLHERALMVNGYIYNRLQVLSMMREFTGQRDMVRTAKTRFTTTFLTLKRFHVQQANLRKMFTSEKWANSRFSKEVVGKRVAEVILMPSFWKNMVFALKVGGPLVKVLRLVDGEKRSPMGYIYEAMDRAKEAIVASFNNNEEKYRNIFEFIDKRWNIQLHRPLHVAGYFLNPECFYSNPDIENDTEVMKGLHKCISRLVRGEDLQDKITKQLENYKKAEGLFGLPMAIRQRTLKSPDDWWSSYGASMPVIRR
ncbi:uncharacterized protein LOC121979531 [Zingiber officinale]|uniref:uncharacterized protein LOC121979531 n=1 Tax=Zingiber officinale TaxID=94328 RepID=UPI001C4C8E9B|nr:uncharacterized protein LOC121979531 [Zingiber officinale]